MSLPDALAAFAEPATTTVTILEIKTDAILDSDDGEFLQLWQNQSPLCDIRDSISMQPSVCSGPRLTVDPAGF
jgi:hypothetical protein